MKKGILIPYLLLFVLLSCSMNNSLKVPPKDFNFEIFYGTYGRNCINTFNNTYTKDLIHDEDIITELELNQKELQIIYNKMMSIDLLNYPDDFKPVGKQGFRGGRTDKLYTIDPYNHIKIKITFNGKLKEINFKDQFKINDKAEALRNLIKEIHEIIEAKDEYKSLPQSIGGYL